MLKHKKVRLIRKVIALALVMTFMFTVMVPTNVMASDYVNNGNTTSLGMPRGMTYQEYDTGIDGSYGQAFGTGNNNRLAIVINASVKSGNPTTVTIGLQKRSVIFFTEKTVTIPVSGKSEVVLSGYPVDTNGVYRLYMECNGVQPNIANLKIAINVGV